MHVQQIKDHIIISKLWPIFYLIGCLLYQTIQTPEPNTYGGLAFCFSSHCTRPDSPLWQAKCNSFCGLGPNRNIWVTYGTWPNPNVAWNIITLFLVPLTTMNQVRSWNPLPKKTNHVDMQSNKRLSAFSIAKRVAVHGINELADVVFPKLANSFHFLLVDTMALAPSQTFPQQPSLQQWLNDWKNLRTWLQLVSWNHQKQSDISKWKQKTQASTESILIFQGRHAIQGGFLCGKTEVESASPNCSHPGLISYFSQTLPSNSAIKNQLWPTFIIK